MKNILELLENSASWFPEKLFIEGEFGGLTYKEMMAEAKRVGSCLAEKLGSKGRPVAVMMKKSPECLAACLGIVYSGNFYTVLDGDMPTERIKKLFSVLEPAAVIVGERELERWDILKKEIAVPLTISYPLLGAVREELLKEIRKNSRMRDIVYVLFTSGSTGVPKGTVICHENLLSYSQWLVKAFDLGPDTVMGNQSPFYFSMSVSDIYGMMRAGGRIKIIPEHLFSFPVKLLEWIRKKGINTIYWVPSAYGIVTSWNALDYVELPKLNKILFAGETMPAGVLKQWRSHLPKAIYANLFGPTETTDICCYYVVDRNFREEESIPIGRPCEGCEILIRKENGEEALPGEEGELYVKGPFVALGYYRDPERTRTAFGISLTEDSQKRIYRTGDIVKLSDRGELLYKGRKDQQIKRRGYRIELGEIEAAAGGVQGVRRCVCVYQNDSKELLLFYEGDRNPQEVGEELKKRLPVYMYLDRLIRLKRIPLNANGKIDRLFLSKKEMEERKE